MKKLSARIMEMKSVHEIVAGVERIEAELEEANDRNMRLTSENNRMREIIGCDPQTHADRQRPITIGDLQDLEQRILRRLGRPDTETVIVLEEFASKDEPVERELGRLVGAERQEP